MEDVAFRFMGIDGVGNLSTAAYVVVSLLFLICTVGFVVWSRGLPRNDPLQDKKFNARYSGQQLFLPVQIKGSSNSCEVSGSAYLRSLTVDRATLVCSDRSLSKGSMLEVYFSVDAMGGGSSNQHIFGKVIRNRRLALDSEDWEVDLKLLTGHVPRAENSLQSS